MSAPLCIHFVTWNDSRRSRSLCERSGMRRTVLVPLRTGLPRHLFGAFQTSRWLLQERPRVVWYQYSLALGFVLAIYSVTFGRRSTLVADVHSKALRRMGPRPFQSLLRLVKGWTLRRCSAVIVTNPENRQFAERKFGCRAHILPDPLPLPQFQSQHQPPERCAEVVFICSFAVDEPLTIIRDTTSILSEHLRIAITGNPRLLSATLRDEIARCAVLTGFLPEQDYWNLLAGARCIVVLSQDSACLPCGAYEALALGHRPILKEDEFVRAVFGEMAVYTELSPGAIAKAISKQVECGPFPQAEELRAKYEAKWQMWWAAFRSELACQGGLGTAQLDPPLRDS